MFGEGLLLNIQNPFIGVMIGFEFENVLVTFAAKILVENFFSEVT